MHHQRPAHRPAGVGGGHPGHRAQQHLQAGQQPVQFGGQRGHLRGAADDQRLAGLGGQRRGGQQQSRAAGRCTGVSLRPEQRGVRRRPRPAAEPGPVHQLPAHLQHRQPDVGNPGQQQRLPQRARPADPQRRLAGRLPGPAQRAQPVQLVLQVAGVGRHRLGQHPAGGGPLLPVVRHLGERPGHPPPVRRLPPLRAEPLLPRVAGCPGPQPRRPPPHRPDQRVQHLQPPPPTAHAAATLRPAAHPAWWQAGGPGCSGAVAEARAIALLLGALLPAASDRRHHRLRTRTCGWRSSVVPRPRISRIRGSH